MNYALSKTCLWKHDGKQEKTELFPLLESSNSNGEVEFTVACTICEKEYPITCSLKGLKDYYIGRAYVQVALPELSPDIRELLVSGTCPVCWDEMFGGEE